MSKYAEIDLKGVKTYPIEDRKNKVKVGDFSAVYDPDSSFQDFLKSLPQILAGRDLDELVSRTVQAVRSQKTVLLLMGAHVIKCGLNPVLIDLMERGVISAIATNGAGSIHDLEIAYWGETSEDVAENIRNGSFGMAKETAEIINHTIAQARKENLGSGEALGKKILQDEAPHKDLSLLASGYRLQIPVTVHVAVGTDIVHQHPSADGAAIGETSLRDFKIFAHSVSELDHGVVLHFGSTVILPEVFLKALTVARNLGYKVTEFTTANFDMIPHYRPRVNVVQRPTSEGGKGFQFIGHHEIMIPLLAAAIKAKLSNINDNRDTW